MRLETAELATDGENKQAPYLKVAQDLLLGIGLPFE